MLDLIEDEYITDEFKLFCELEDLVFEATNDSLTKALNLFHEFQDLFSSQYLKNLIIRVAAVRPQNYKQLAWFWSNIPINSEDIPFSRFTDYLSKLGMIPSSSVSWRQSKLTKEEIEDFFPRNSLFFCAANGDLKTLSYISADVNKIMTETTTIDSVDMNGEKLTCIDVAALFGSLSAFKFLMIQGLPITKTTIKCSVRGGNADIIETLDQMGFSFNDCFEVAVVYHRNELATWLYENYGRDKNVDLLTCLSSFNTSIIPLITSLGTDLETRDESRRSPLHIAVLNGNYVALKYLLDLGANIEIIDNHYRTPLIMSAQEGNDKLVELCVGRGANIDASDYCHQTALIWASKKGYEKILKFLLKNGANKNAKDNYGRTCIDLSYSKEIMNIIDNM